MTLPGFLTLRRLEGRIVALFLALLLVVQIASFAVIRSSIERNANTSIAAELKTGERVFRRLLVQEAEKRSDAAALLAQDYGFKQAVGLPLAEQGTVETIQDALANQGERIGATTVAYFDNNLKLVAATSKDAGRFLDLLKQKVQQPEKTIGAGAATKAGKPSQNEDVQLALLDQQAYQVVAVPVRTPAPVGWILMGFQLDDATLQDLRNLSELQGVVVVRSDGQRWRALVSSLEKDAATRLAAQIPDNQSLFPAELSGEELRGRFAPLVQQQLAVVLLRSFDDAVAPYRALQWTLLALTVVGVLAFSFFSVLLARRISGPIKDLSAAAERLGAGDYTTPVLRTSKDEVGDLAEAFETMRQGIRAREAQVERLAYWDPLTGLPNREQFGRHLQECLDRTGEAGRPFSILMLDLDRFKHVNDVLGHHFGDRLLCGVAARLRQPAVCGNGFIARLGGDEFAVLLEGHDLEQAVAVAQRILTAFEEPVTIDDNTVDLGAGIGVVGSPQHGQEVQLLLSRAELAMYTAKQKQSGTMVYHPGLDAHSQESLSLLSELRRAVEHNELRLYLQPKVDLHTGRILGAESLVRWQHPQRGLVPPMLFIPFAEQTGFIRTLTTWIIEQSARAWREMYAHGLDLRLSINLSTRDLLDQDLPAKLEQLIKTHDMNAQVLCLEITESAIMDDPQRAQQTLERLHELGFKLSIDDFGTGYSSLAYLKRLPVHELKIDKSFVMAMESDLDDAKIVRSTIDLAHNLGLRVVAEGIETAKAWKLLDALHCDEGQGYFIAKPMPEREFVAWVKAWEAPALEDETLESAFAKLA